MKILWLAHAVPYPPSAGFLLRSYNLLRELARQHEVDLVAFVQESWITTTFPSLQAGLEESRRALGEFCRTVTFLPIESLGSRWGKQLTGLRALFSGSTYTTSWLVGDAARQTIRDTVRRRSFDLVHFDTIGLAPYRELAANLPATLTHHNIESHMMLRRAENASHPLARAYFRLEGRRLREFERRTAARFTSHITCSDLDSKRLLEVAPEAKATVVPNGVDCEFFAPQSRGIRPNSVVFVGTMNWYPNVQAMSYFLREIWPALKIRVPEATLDIAGSNPPESIIQLARSLPNVSVHGYLPDIRPLVDSASVFACPILDGGGTKLKILDAFAMRKCVVAHPIACEGIEVTAGKNVILASTTDEFVHEIASLFGDEARREAVASAARTLVESKYSYRELGRKFNSTLEEAACHSRVAC